jgi:hypothetical protein
VLREKRAAFEVKLPASNTCRLRTLAFLDDKKLINESSFHHLGLFFPFDGINLWFINPK